VKDLAEMFPQRFSNKTNGVTPRRWLLLANPALARAITEAIGDGWITDLGELAKLKPLAADSGFRDAFRAATRAAKSAVPEWLELSPTSEVLAAPLTNRPFGAVAALVALVALRPRWTLMPPISPVCPRRPRARGAPAVVALRPRRVLVGLVGVVVVLVGVGFVGQRRYFRRRYSFQPGISQLSRTWAFFRRVHHARVGVVGTFGGFFAYPLYGVDGSNHVRYIAARGPHGSFTAIGSCPDWRRAVNTARLHYLVTTPARDPWHPRVLTPSPERGWTVSDPAATIAFQSRAGSQYITVFAVHGRLDPSRCPPSSR